MNLIDSSVPVALKDQFSAARAKKAYGAGVAGAITGAATISLSGVFADGKIDGAEVVGAIGAVVGGFVVGFFGAWLPSQNTAAPRKQDAITYGDGLAAEPDGPEHRAA